MGCHHSEAMQEKICQQQDGCVLCPSTPQGCFRVGKGRKNHWFLWHRRLAWAQGRCSGDAELCWDSECRYLKKNVFHRLDASISESELDANQDPIPTRRKPTQLLYFRWCFEELISDLWFFPALSLHPLRTMRFDICRKKDKNIASVLLSLPAVGSPQWPCREQIAVWIISRADLAFPVIFTEAVPQPL